MADPNKLGPTHDIHFDLQGNPVDYARQSLLHKLAVSLISDPGLSPMPLGVVAGSKGGQLLADQLASEADKLTPAKAIVRYVQLKYPKLMSKISNVELSGNWWDNPGYSGMYFPQPENKIFLRIKKGPGAAENMIETLGHELTHGAIQEVRTPELISSKNYMPATSNLEAYYNQPAEVNARQGGATALSTMLNFVNHYPILNKIFGGIQTPLP